jgi:hypothetical protein
LGIGWISTDLLMEVLRVQSDELVPAEWNADPGAIAATAARFFNFLERFVWGVTSLAESYVIEGAGFLPAQVAQLASQYQLRSVFLGCSHMTLERFDRYPGRSRGYAELPEVLRRRIVGDVPLWSDFVRREAERCGYPYIDVADDFPARLREAESILTAGP